MASCPASLRAGLLLISLCSVMSANYAVAQISTQDTGITLKIVARPDNWTGEGKSVAGHVYIVIGLKTNSGIKEETLGFYGEGNSGTLKGPGMLKAEDRCHPTNECTAKHQQDIRAYMAATSDSISIPITVAQRQAIYHEASSWNFKSRDPRLPDNSARKEYIFWDQNCVSFVSSVVAALKIDGPPGSWTKPTSYLAALKEKVDAQREARQKDEARMEREQRERDDQAARDEAKRREEMARQAEAVPAGWIACSCAAAHSHHGRVIRGVRYHPRGPSCPSR